MEIQVDAVGVTVGGPDESQTAQLDPKSPTVHTGTSQGFQKIPEPQGTDGLSTVNNHNHHNADDDDYLSSVNEKNLLIQEVDEGRPCLECYERCPGFQKHFWRSTCHNCKCPREVHDIYHEDFVDVRQRLGWDDPHSAAKSAPTNGYKDDTIRAGYSWVPRDLSVDKIEDFMTHIPPDRVPRLGSTGERYRDIQLIVQLPKQDLSQDYCGNLSTPGQMRAFDDFCRLRDEEALGIGKVEPYLQAENNCNKCGVGIEAGETGVVAPKISDLQAWHPACFCCSTCDELLVDLVYCHLDGAIYCERHYAELIKPRCAACDELIFSGEYTKAMEQDWHSTHFCCFNCDLNLTGHRYILRDEHPYCIKCYENLFANGCEECKTPIGTDSKDLSYKEKHWHEKCFYCSDCRNSLVDQPFASKNEKLFCADCHDNNFAARCDGCQNIFKAGMKKYEYKGKQWHEQCFCCKVCQQPIGSKSFIPRDQEVVCVPCYEEQYAQRCMKCNGVINKGGITYKGTPWHRECFVCTNCTKTLAGEKFTSRDEKPFCAECFGDLFAKKCIRCTKPITGLGGTKFISFEERHWHSDCFVCYRCNVSLVGRGFLTDNTDILCPDCGRA